MKLMKRDRITVIELMCSCAGVDMEFELILIPVHLPDPSDNGKTLQANQVFQLDVFCEELMTSLRIPVER